MPEGKKDKIAVLGSNSFAASAFVSEALDRKYQVFGISRSPLEKGRLRGIFPDFQFRQLDLNQNLSQVIEVLTDFKPETIVDFAGQGMVAESWQAPEQWYQTNIVAKVRLHHWLKDQKWLKKYVRISTPEVYGSCEYLIDESRNYAPSTPYAVSHAAIDMSLKSFFQRYEFPVVIGRFANFYGEGQQLYRIIPKTILSVLSGKKLSLHGGGKSIRAFIHGKDVAAGIFKMIYFSSIGGVYHFSPTKFISIRDLVELISVKLGVCFENAIEISPDRPGKDQAYLMSSEKAQRELNWYPQIDLEEGTDRSIRWISSNFNELSKISWEYRHKA